MINQPELNMSNDQVERLLAGQRSLQKQFDAFAETQDQLVYTISGNPLDKDDKGLIGNFRNVEIKVNKIDGKVNKGFWTVIGIVAGITFLLNILMLFFKL